MSEILRKPYLSVLLIFLTTYAFAEKGKDKDFPYTNALINPIDKVRNELGDATSPEYYSWDEQVRSFKPLPKPLPFFYLKKFSNDPIRFSFQTSKTNVRIGEEIEIKIIAEHLDISPSLLFTFEELRDYSLKVIVPEGFVQTGGNYLDDIRGRVDATNRRKEYVLKGKFTQYCDDCEFKLLRGGKETSVTSIYEKKQVLHFNVSDANTGISYEEENIALRKAREIASGVFEVLTGHDDFRITTACPQRGEPISFVAKFNNTTGSTRTVYLYTCYRDLTGISQHVFQVPSGGVQSFTFIETLNNSTSKNVLHTHVFNAPVSNFTNPDALGCCNEIGRHHDIDLLTAFPSVNFTISPISENHLAGASKVISTAGCNSTVTWSTGQTGAAITVNPNSSGSHEYTATCTTSVPNQPDCIVTLKSTLNVSVTCNNNFTPTLKSTTSEIVAGDFAELTVEGCSEDVYWYYNGVLQSGNKSSGWFVSQPGTYTAKCNTSCGLSNLSNSINLSLAPLRIAHNKQSNDVYSGESVTLTAIGCNSGWWVQWQMNDGSYKNGENPVTGSGPGTYKARCVNGLDGNIISSWVNVTFGTRQVDRPTVNRSTTSCVYDNQVVTLGATCQNGLTVQWSDGTTSGSPAYKNVSPGNYWVKCCSGGQCGPTEDIYICRLDADPITISSNKQDPNDLKTYANPNEPVILTASGCSSGVIRWEVKGSVQWGNPMTVYGPGIYKARCYISDFSIGNESMIEVFGRPLGALTITSNKENVFPGEPLTLTATGCSFGIVRWEYVKEGVSYTETGKSIDVNGPNTYSARCISYGLSGILSTITIPSSSGVPTIFTDKTKVGPNETFVFKVDFSTCYLPEWSGGYSRVTQNGVTRSEWGVNEVTVTGPATIVAYCENRTWQQKKVEVILAPIDNLNVVANKNKVFPGDQNNPAESVVLTAYGCEFGFIEWKIGTTLISGSQTDPKRQITQYGPGYYKARCRDDFSTNTDWVTVYVAPSYNIQAIVSGPDRMCPNSPVTLTATGCPGDYYTSWYTFENEWQNFGTSIQIHMPQKVRVRCRKYDESYVSQEKEFTIEPSFPEIVRAKDNGPLVPGSTAVLTVTDIPGATYLWTAPAGVTLANNTTRSISIPSVTDAHAGEYTVKVSYGGCSIETSTQLQINTCDNLYIKVTNPLTGERTTILPRKPNTVNQYDKLLLSVETYEGDVLKNVTYNWQNPPGFTGSQDINSPYLLETDKIGTYKVQVSSASSNCELKVDISAIPCKIYPDTYNCGTSTSADVVTDIVNLSSLVPGDIFTSGDYEVTVTEATGSAAVGWSGKGVLYFSFINGGSGGSDPAMIPIEVKFNSIKVNQCYQLAAGEVITEYDPAWWTIYNNIGANNLLNDIKEAYTEILDLVKNFDGSAAQKEVINEKLADLELDKGGISGLAEVIPSERNDLVAKINEANADITCLLNQNTSGARIAAMEITNTCSVEGLQTKISNVQKLAEMASTLPEGVELRSSTDLCNPSTLPSLTSLTGIDPDYGINKMGNCLIGNKDLQFNIASAGEECISPSGFTTTYRGLWEGYEYFIITKNGSTSDDGVYYITRKIGKTGYCWEHNIATGKDWSDCRKGNNSKCDALWKRVSVPFGLSTGGQAVDAIEVGFVALTGGIVLAEVALAAGAVESVSFELFQAAGAVEAFLDAMGECENCTQEQLTTKFAGKLATSIALNQFFRGVGVGLEYAFASKYIQTFTGAFAAKFKGVVGKVAEIKAKSPAIWDNFKYEFIRKIGESGGQRNIALGLAEDLFNFAKIKGFLTYREFTSGGLQKDIIEAEIKNVGNKIHFNLTGFSLFRYQKFSQTFNVGDIVPHWNITNWELYLIYNTPGVMERTTFYKLVNGNYIIVPKPF